MANDGNTPPPLGVRRAAVLGAGVMGAAISGHLANAGIPNLLLDMKADPSTAPDGAEPDALARRGLKRLLTSRPPALFDPSVASLIETGNFDDDLARLGACDWVVEAVVEDLDVKRSLFGRVAPHLGPQAVFTSNTSGLPARELAEALPESVRPRFFVTHFFNPPRYLHLLELVATEWTDPDVMARFARFAEKRLGKGIVVARDTPNFIANRIGCYAMFQAMWTLRDFGLGVADVDQLTGPLIGRPKSATFRTADVVGLDTLAHVARNLHERLAHDPERDLFRLPEFFEAMLAKGWIGEKAGGGFYRRDRDANGRRVILALDLDRLEYGPSAPREWPAAARAHRIADVGRRIAAAIDGDDPGARFLAQHLDDTIAYAARCLPEIASDPAAIDRAMRWGFGWTLGPFEILDVLGPSAVIRRLERRGREVPDVLGTVASREPGTVYAVDDGVLRVLDPVSGARRALRDDPEALSFAALRRKAAPRAANAAASLFDLGEGVCGLELHGKMNTLGSEAIAMIEQALDVIERDAIGLVIATDAENFSAGADLALVLSAATAGDWEAVHAMVRRFQALNQRIRFCDKPVVVATRGLVLGGGCEMALAAAKVVAAAETYAGLVEVGAGVVPAGGGCLQMLRRAHATIGDRTGVDPMPFVTGIFETIGTARVSSSALEARRMGLLAPSDRIVMNPRHLLGAARTAVVSLVREDYRPPQPERALRVVGRDGFAVMRSALANLHRGGRIGDYDRVVGERLAWVLAGGDVDAGAEVDEEYLLDLERHAFVELCRDERTRARMEHLLATGKPLRN